MSRTLSVLLLAVVSLFTFCASMQAQTTASMEGRVLDPSGAAIPKANVTAVNDETAYSRTAVSSTTGAYQLQQLPVGSYTVTAEVAGFKKGVRKVHLDLGDIAVVDFSLQVGQVEQQVEVRELGETVEPTRTMVSSVIAEREIQTLPVNGRQFIDFALLAPGVTIGDTTSGSTDVIIEPVTKLSFAGQNIHFNFFAVDGADSISTASGIQKTTPSQEAVQEFRVINSSYSTEFGRAVGGIVNIITKSGGNEVHGSLYEFFRHDALDSRNILTSPDLPTCTNPSDFSTCQFLDKLRQNQFGGTVGGPISKNKTFFFGNYEGQRRRESPFYNSVILQNIALINQLKCTNFGTQPCGAPGTLPQEDLKVTRSGDYDTFLVKLDHNLTQNHYLTSRYYFNDARYTSVSPLNDGFDLPSGFKDNFFRDQSVVVNLNSTFSPTLLNDLRGQFARRFFDFVTVSTQPHLEVANTFTVGVNRGNPDFYAESRFEIVDNVTKIAGRHTLGFGGNFNWVRTTESFPLFYPFEATFGCLLSTQCGNSFEAGAPFVIFFQRNDPTQQISGNPLSVFTEPTLIPGGTAVYQGSRIPTQIRDLAKGELDHTYNGFFAQDKWRATDRLTLNFGVRFEFETWPSNVIDNPFNVDPRAGFALSLGTSRNIVLRGGVGLFHGIIPSPLLMCQIPSCGGVLGEFPGREAKQDDLNANTRLFAMASDPFVTQAAMSALLNTGTYPDAALSPGLITCPAGLPLASQTAAGCPNSFLGDAVIVRFAQDHEAPYGIQNSLGLEFQPFADAVFNISYLGVRGKKLGSFWNVNQPAPSDSVILHDSNGNAGAKNRFYLVCFDDPDGPGGVPPTCAPGAGVPGIAQFPFAVYFEADSLWNSNYDGLLVNFNKRMSHHFAIGASYTWSRTIDDGPNPSFVLIPQDNVLGLAAERTISSDHAAQRFVLNATIAGPTNSHPIVNGWELGTIVTLESPHFFTKFSGFDSNGDVFGVNDRVGIESRNTFEGDSFQSIDLRIARTFSLSERWKLQGIAEAFNLFNTVNVRFFNTVYGAADFCPFNPAAAGCAGGPFNNLEGSPNPAFGTPRAVNNPRQLQFAVRLTF